MIRDINKEMPKIIPHRSNEIDQAIKDQTKLDNYSVDQMRKLAEKLQLIVDVSPFNNKSIKTVSGNTSGGSTTLLTVGAVTEVYLTNIHLDVYYGVEDGGQGSAYVTWTDEGGTTSTYYISSTSAVLAGGSHHNGDIQFPLKGVKLKAGTTVTLTSPFALNANAVIGYYEHSPTISSLHAY